MPETPTTPTVLTAEQTALVWQLVWLRPPAVMTPEALAQALAGVATTIIATEEWLRRHPVEELLGSRRTRIDCTKEGHFRLSVAAGGDPVPAENVVPFPRP